MIYPHHLQICENTTSKRIIVCESKISAFPNYISTVSATSNTSTASIINKVSAVCCLFRVKCKHKTFTESTLSFVSENTQQQPSNSTEQHACRSPNVPSPLKWLSHTVDQSEPEFLQLLKITVRQMVHLISVMPRSSAALSTNLVPDPFALLIFTSSEANR